MRIEDLTFFLTVAETGHLGRASERMGQSQSAVTKGVQRLERELELQLFNRTPKGMVLTTPGHAFFERARHVRIALDAAIQEANDLHQGKLGIVRVGVGTNYIHSVFAEACVALARQRPAARVKLIAGLHPQLSAGLRAGDLDLTIGTLELEDTPEFVQVPLFPDSLSVVARKSHPLFYAARLSFRDLAECGWVLTGPSTFGRRAVESLFAEFGFPPVKVVVESSSSVSQLTSIIRSTDFLTLVPDSVLREASGYDLVPVGLPQTVFPRLVGITTRRDAYLSPLVTRFIELLMTRKVQAPNDRNDQLSRD